MDEGRSANVRLNHVFGQEIRRVDVAVGHSGRGGCSLDGRGWEFNKVDSNVYSVGYGVG